MMAPFDDWHALRWTPDGKALSFVHNTTGSTQNLYIVSLSGGAPVQLTHFASEPVFVPAYAWSKDGKKFALTRALQRYGCRPVQRIPLGAPETLSRI